MSETSPMPPGLIERLRTRDAPPRIGVFLFGSHSEDILRKTLARIPAELDLFIEEVVVMPEEPLAGAPPQVDGLAPGRALAVRVHRPPREGGYGGARKAAFEYALHRGFDLVVTLRGDGIQPPEHLPAMLEQALEEPGCLVIATRRTWESSIRPFRRAAHLATTAWQNRLLGLRIHDYHSGYRVYARATLESIPFQLDSDDRLFEIETVIQCRALGVPIRQLEVPPVWREHASNARGLRWSLAFSGTALSYRLHQLHVTKDGRYLVDQGVHYTLKSSPSSSHAQIVEAIRPGTQVLDLGCSQGLLARPLRDKGVRVTGVDVGPPRQLAAELAEYHQRDLEQPLEIPCDRIFDYVVCSDVIEHLRNRQELLRSVRRYLKPSGRLVISTPNVALWFYRLSLLAGRFEYGPKGVLDETHVHLYTRASFRREVQRAGFEITEQHVTALPFEVVFASTGRSRLIRAMASAYHGLARLWPSLFAYQVILAAEITTLDEEATDSAA